MRFDEHADRRLVDEVLRGGLPLGAVAADAGSGCLELGQRIASGDPVELGMTERPEWVGAVGGHEQLGADGNSLDDRDQGDGLLGRQERRVPLEDRHLGHQASSSM